MRGKGTARAAALIVAGLALLQVGLGIQTVISVSPLWLSLLHQFGAAVLWAAALVAARTAWR
jgi:heme A synthase